MIQVTKKEFYDAINPRDICIRSTGEWGRTITFFETRDRQEVGRARTSEYYDENGTLISVYYMTKAFYNEVRKINAPNN